MTFDQIVSERRVIICVGSGGVGKTTTSAAIAVHAARKGRRTLVMTIDPAKRLANSLGLSGLGSEEQEVPRAALALGGPLEEVKGTLHAMMLDQKRAFDEVVEHYAEDAGQRQRILDNPIYKQISASLAGSQEYAAMAKLYAIDREDRYDLIVVDTPPTANALDFLEAPQKITDAVDSPAIGWFLKGGARGMRAFGMGASFVLKRLARFTGAGFIDDMSRFVTEFQSVLVGFKDRAREVYQLMRNPRVGFVLVTSPEALAVDEVLAFHDRLAASQMPCVAFVVNRVHGAPGPAPSREDAAARLQLRPELSGLSPYELTQAVDEMTAAHDDIEHLARGDAAAISRLEQRAGQRYLYLTVPFLRTDVHDLAGLAQISERLFS